MIDFSYFDFYVTPIIPSCVIFLPIGLSFVTIYTKIKSKEKKNMND